MLVKYFDDQKKRSDGKDGKPTGLTVGNTYTVVEDLGYQFTLMNNDMKLARYSKCRFEVVDDSPIPNLRDAFNTLTTEMRRAWKRTT